jgi:pimeloyl-ACP methyl ester carboxylesterase
MVTSEPSTVDTRPTAVAPRWTEIDWRPYVRDARVDGRNLRYLDYGAGPVLLLLHGLGCCWQWWLEVLPALGLQRRVIAVDLPGFGHSDVLPSPGAMTTHADGMAALIEQLGLADVAVAGHSMGGLVALELGRRRPDLVGRVILVNAGGVPMSEGRLRAVVGVIKASHALLGNDNANRALTRRPRARALLSKIAIGNSGALSRELAAEVVPLMAAPGYVEAVIAAARAVRDTNPEAVAQPTLLLWGANDPIVPVSAAEEMARRLPNPTLVVIHGTGHSPHVAKPDQFIAEVLTFTGAR